MGDEVLSVDLRWTAATDLAERVAVAIGAPTTPHRAPEASLLEHLAGRRMLLVWYCPDGVRAAAVALAARLREHCPLVRIRVLAAEAPVDRPALRRTVPATTPRLELAGAVSGIVGPPDAGSAARHTAHFAALAAAADAGLAGRDQARWLQRLSAERANLAAALDRLAQRDDPEEALRMAGTLGQFCWLTGAFGEGVRMLRFALDLPGADRPTSGRAAALHALGRSTFWHETGPHQARRSGALFEEAVDIYRRCGDQAALAPALRDLGSHYNSVGDVPRAGEFLEEGLAVARRLGDVATAGTALAYLGIVASYENERAKARTRLEEALVLLSAEGSDDEVRRAQFFLACLECDDGNRVAARARFAALIEGRQLIGTLRYTTAFALDGLARLAATEGRFTDALGVFGAASAAHRRLGTGAGAGYAAYVRRGLDSARRACGEQAADLIDQGRQWHLDEAVERGLTTGEPSGEPLRSRELEVLRLVEAGLADVQIARRLFLSPRTVGNHLGSAFRRLGVHNRTAAVHRARQLGVL